MQSFTTQQARERFVKDFNDIQKSKDIVNNVRQMLHQNDIENLSRYLKYNKYNDLLYDKDTISVVMCVKNRSAQTYFTLKTISSSSIKNVQLIIVEDSDKDCLDPNILSNSNISIEHILIDNSIKHWINPCVNYNLGFLFVKGSKIVIQNPEVCYIGDVLDYVNRNLTESKYLVFDVINFKSIDDNHTLYRATSSKFKHYLNNTNYGWYQHHSTYNRGFHFLSAITRNDLVKIGGGFDLDYSMGVCYDDDALVDQIKFNNIRIVCVPNNNMSIYGIHQWHPPTYNGMNKSDLHNKNLLFSKRSYMAKNNKYLNITSIDDITNFIF